MKKTFILLVCLALRLLFPVTLHAAPPTIATLRAEVPVEADGKLDESVWKRCSEDPHGAAVAWRRVGKPNQPSSDQRTAYFAYDQKYLFVALVVKYGDGLPSDSDVSGGTDSVRLDFDGVALGITSDGQQQPDIMLPYLVPIRFAVQGTDNGWTAEIALEWSQLHVSPKAGMKIPFNIGGRDVSGPISWAPVADVRDVKSFGVLELQ